MPVIALYKDKQVPLILKTVTMKFVILALFVAGGKRPYCFINIQLSTFLFHEVVTDFDIYTEGFMII